MRGRRQSERGPERGTGPHPDWKALEWFIYDDPVVLTCGAVTTEPIHTYRVSPRKLSPGEYRRFETLVCVVARCSLRTVRRLLKEGVEPLEIQGAVDIYARFQAQRTAPQPNLYCDLLEKWKAKGAVSDDAAQAA